MRYFITLNIDSEKDYKSLVNLLIENGYNASVDGVTLYEFGKTHRESLSNTKKALTAHKKVLEF